LNKLNEKDRVQRRILQPKREEVKVARFEVLTAVLP
jgi:hypothetical protein